jgi:hypothetical protein
MFLCEVLSCLLSVIHFHFISSRSRNPVSQLIAVGSFCNLHKATLNKTHVISVIFFTFVLRTPTDCGVQDRKVPTAVQRTSSLLQCFNKKIQFLPYGRSIGLWICLTHKTYTCHTVQNTIRYIRFTEMKVRYTIFEWVTMYNNAKRKLRKLQWFISTVILL